MRVNLDMKELKATTWRAKKENARRAKSEAERRKEENRQRGIAAAKTRRANLRKSMAAERAWAKDKIAEIEKRVAAAASKGQNTLLALDLTFPVAGLGGKDVLCPWTNNNVEDPKNWPQLMKSLPPRFGIMWRALSKFERKLKWHRDSVLVEECENPYIHNRVENRYWDHTDHYYFTVSW